jgi:3'-5' exoribonuclease
MIRRSVSQIGPQESVDEVFIAVDKQMRPNRNGVLYLQFDLRDATGTLSARLWNATESVFQSFDDGDYVRVEGTTQVFQGALQMIATRIERVAPEEVNPAAFLPSASIDIERHTYRLRQLLATIEHPGLKVLADCFLADSTFLRKFTQAPAGIKNHHAYIGGLLEHVVNLMELVDRIAPRYPQLDRDLMLLGAFLHDAGKVDELSYDRGFAYTDEGQLIGHLVMGVELLDDKVRDAERKLGEPLPREAVLRLKHIIVSHHGEYEFGSPRLPMTLEAIALHHLDNLDAKVHSFHQQMRDDPNSGSSWTLFNHQIGRKLFKGAAPPGDGPPGGKP